MSELALYSYYRSSSCYRVRIALQLKGLPFESRFVHLLRGGGENWRPAYRQVNPQGLVPTLVDGSETLTQSVAIIEYLEETHPEPPLLPSDPRDRAYVRALAQLIACDIQPLNNLRVLEHLRQLFPADAQASEAWYRHWVEQGLAAVEALLLRHRKAGVCCYGDTPTLADCCLIPQVYNARRFDCDLQAFPIVHRIDAHCTLLPAFQAAAPENQGDAT